MPIRGILQSAIPEITVISYENDRVNFLLGLEPLVVYFSLVWLYVASNVHRLIFGEKEMNKVFRNKFLRTNNSICKYNLLKSWKVSGKATLPWISLLVRPEKVNFYYIMIRDIILSLLF